MHVYLSGLPAIHKNEDAPELNVRSIASLLYADDLIIISKSLDHLKLLEYGKRNSLQINKSKTKIMVFNPNGKKLNCYTAIVRRTTSLRMYQPTNT